VVDLQKKKGSQILAEFEKEREGTEGCICSSFVEKLVFRKKMRSEVIFHGAVLRMMLLYRTCPRPKDPSQELATDSHSGCKCCFRLLRTVRVKYCVFFLAGIFHGGIL